MRVQLGKNSKMSFCKKCKIEKCETERESIDQPNMIDDHVSLRRSGSKNPQPLVTKSSTRGCATRWGFCHSWWRIFRSSTPHPNMIATILFCHFWKGHFRGEDQGGALIYRGCDWQTEGGGGGGEGKWTEFDLFTATFFFLSQAIFEFYSPREVDFANFKGPKTRATDRRI